MRGHIGQLRRSKTSRRAVALVGAALAGIAMAAAGCKGPPPADGRERVVAVGSQWYGHLPVWVGIEHGIFAARGFDVTWRVIGKSMDRLNAISSGEAQFASLGEIAMLSAMAQGNQRFYWVGNQDIAPGFEGMVGRPGIDSIAALRGKKIGFPFGSSVDVTCRLLLKEHGLDPDKDVQLVNLEVGDVPAVFRSGNIAAALIWEPGFSQLLDVPGAKVLAMDTDTEIYRRFGTMTGPDVLVLSRKWVTADPERARRFMAGYFEALDWVKHHPDQAAALAAGKYVQQEPQLLRDNLAKFVWRGAHEQRDIMSEQGMFGQVEFLLDVLHEQMRVLPTRPKFRAWVNTEVLPPAAPIARERAAP